MASPIDPPLEKLVRELKSKNHTDGWYWELVSRESAVFQENAPLKRGTKYSDLKGAKQSVIDLHPTGLWFSEEILPLRSSEVGGMPGDRFLVWVWSTDWVAQSSTNADITYSASSVSHPIFERDYVIRRDEWFLSQTIAPGSALTALIGATITAAGTGYTYATGTVGTATLAAVCSGGAIIAWIVTKEGSAITSGAAITITGDGAGATATAVIQPATAVLVEQEKHELPQDSNLSKEFILARRNYETLPGVEVRSDDWDEEARVLISTYRQRVLASAYTPPVVGSTKGTGSIIVHSLIASLSIIDPGSSYIALPTMAIAASPGGGTQATGTVNSLKVVTATPQTLGSSYAIGDTLTVTGGTSTTAATLTVATMSLATLAANAAGSSYAPGDLIILQGGNPANGAATLLLVTTKLVSLVLNAAGTVMVPGATLTLVGGTSTTSATLTISTTKLVSATIGTAGTGGADGAQTATGTTGTGTKFQIAVTVSGGAITAIGAISVVGAYTVNPTNIASEPVSVTGGGLTDARLTVVMGVATFAIANAGVFTANSATFTSTGGGNNATFNTALFGVNTFTIASGGGYSTTSTTFTQNSVAPVGGLGATFQTGTWTVATLSIAGGGAYTVISPSPAATTTGGAGTGLTVVLSYGVGAVTLTNAGTLYYANSPAVTLSAGNALVTSVSDALAIQTGATGYVIDIALLETEMDAVKLAVTVACPLPPTVVVYYNDFVNLPPLLFSIAHFIYCNFSAQASLVTRYRKEGGNAQQRLHRLTFSYSLIEPAAETNNGWVTQDVHYDGKVINFSFNGVLNDALFYSSTFGLSNGSSCAFTESYSFPATIPSASGFAGHYYALRNLPAGWRGNMFKRTKLEFLA